MGKFRVGKEELPKLHIEKQLKSVGKASVKKIHKIFNELAKTPFQCEGNAETFKYQLAGKCSREINKKDRIVYKTVEEV